LQRFDESSAPEGDTMDGGLISDKPLHDLSAKATQDDATRTKSFRIRE